jgi:dTMP kinase
MFIALEGLDGSGSTTQGTLLKENLESIGKSVVFTKEPTSDTPIGRMLRDVLQHKWEAGRDCLQLLFTADRAQHVKQVIKPALDQDKIVITDRYFFSTLAYGFTDMDFEWLKCLNKNFPVPDITFYLKLDPAQCIKRIENRGKGFEYFEKEESLKKVAAGYAQVVRDFPEVRIIDSDRPIPEVQNDIWKIVSKMLLY